MEKQNKVMKLITINKRAFKMLEEIIIMHIQLYLDMLIKWALTSGLKIIFVVILMILALKLVDNFTEKLIKNFVSSNYDSELEKRVHTLRTMTKSILDVLILAVGSMIILEKLGINIGPMLAAAGVVGLAVGFGSQRLVEDLISGFIILIGDQIRVGDVIKIGDKSGLVEKVDLKMVVLRDVEGSVHFIRNGKIDIITKLKNKPSNVNDLSKQLKKYSKIMGYSFTNVFEYFQKSKYYENSYK